MLGFQGLQRKKKAEVALFQGAMNESEIAQEEAMQFAGSEKRRWMQLGQRYYAGQHDILQRPRTAIGERGETVAVRNMADNRICHAFLRDLVDQKCQYLLGRPFSVTAGGGMAEQRLNEWMDAEFSALLLRWARDALVAGIGWLYVYYDEKGTMRFRRMRPEEIAPIWADEEHRTLDAVLRCYEREEYQGRQRRIVECVSLWDAEGVRHYRRESGRLRPDKTFGAASEPHFRDVVGGKIRRGGFGTVPFIPLKYNDEEQPLLQSIKTMIDAYDRIVSDNSNALEDQPNSILVLRNYDGQNLGEFRRNLAAYRAVKVSDDGGVDILPTAIDHTAASAQLDRLRRDIYAFGRGIDHRADRIGAAASGVALRHEYAALDLDCNGLEWQCKVALQKVCEFLFVDWEARAENAFERAAVEFTFSRDIITNEESAIDMAKKSSGMLSQRTILANHPWVRDVNDEIRQMEQNQRGEGTGEEAAIEEEKQGENDGE
jgi:phage portal protein, SPP1 family